MKWVLALAPLIMLAAFGQDASYLFRDVSAEAGIHAMHRAVWDVYEAKEGYLAAGQAWGDYDNDGWPDLYLAATALPRLSGTFYSGRQPDFEDFQHPYPDALFRNNGDGTFENVSARLENNSRPSFGFAYADYDQDGFVDFVLGLWGEGYALYRNQGAAGANHNWLSIRLTGGGPVNRDAVGAKAYVTTTGGRTQHQQVMNGSSLGAGNDPALHFGLSDARVAHVRIVWTDGTERVYEDVPVNTIWKVAYGE